MIEPEAILKKFSAELAEVEGSSTHKGLHMSVGALRKRDQESGQRIFSGGYYFGNLPLRIQTLLETLGMFNGFEVTISLDTGVTPYEGIGYYSATFEPKPHFTNDSLVAFHDPYKLEIATSGVIRPSDSLRLSYAAYFGSRILDEADADFQGRRARVMGTLTRRSGVIFHTRVLEEIVTVHERIPVKLAP